MRRLRYACCPPKLPIPAAMEPQSRVYISWLLIVSFFYYYNAWVIPLRSVFDYQTDENLWWWLAADYTADLIYIMDLLLFKPRVMYLDNGFWINQPSLMRLYYMKTPKFRYDLVSLLPLDLLYFQFGPISILRLPRLAKIHTFWEFWNRIDTVLSSPHAVRVIRTVLYMLFLIHLNTCAYYGFSKLEGIGTNSWVFQGKGNAYIRCFYFATKTATSIGKNPKPQNEAEYLFMTCSWLMGVFVFALLIGQIRDIVATATRNQNEYRRVMDHTQAYLHRLNLPKVLQDRIRLWFSYTWQNQKTLNEMRCLESLPRKMRTDIAINVHIQTLAKVQLFQDCDKALLRDLVLKLRPVLYLPGDFVCKKGEVGKEMYIVQSGQVLVMGGEKGDLVLATLGEGSVFGEISLLALAGGNRRTANVRSRGFSSLFVLSKVDLQATIKDYPEAQEILKNKAKRLIRQNEEREKQEPTPDRDIIIKSREGTPKLLHAVLQVVRPDSYTATVIRRSSHTASLTSPPDRHPHPAYRPRSASLEVAVSNSGPRVNNNNNNTTSTTTTNNNNNNNNKGLPKNSLSESLPEEDEEHDKEFCVGETKAGEHINPSVTCSSPSTSTPTLHTSTSTPSHHTSTSTPTHHNTSTFSPTHHNSTLSQHTSTSTPTHYKSIPTYNTSSTPTYYTPNFSHHTTFTPPQHTSTPLPPSSVATMKASSSTHRSACPAQSSLSQSVSFSPAKCPVVASLSDPVAVRYEPLMTQPKPPTPLPPKHDRSRQPSGGLRRPRGRVASGKNRNQLSVHEGQSTSHQVSTVHQNEISKQQMTSDQQAARDLQETIEYVAAIEQAAIDQLFAMGHQITEYQQHRQPGARPSSNSGKTKLKYESSLNNGTILGVELAGGSQSGSRESSSSLRNVQVRQPSSSSSLCQVTSVDHQHNMSRLRASVSQRLGGNKSDARASESGNTSLGILKKGKKGGNKRGLCKKRLSGGGGGESGSNTNKRNTNNTTTGTTTNISTTEDLLIQFGLSCGGGAVPVPQPEHNSLTSPDSYDIFLTELSKTLPPGFTQVPSISSPIPSINSPLPSLTSPLLPSLSSLSSPLPSLPSPLLPSLSSPTPSLSLVSPLSPPSPLPAPQVSCAAIVHRECSSSPDTSPFDAQESKL